MILTLLLALPAFACKEPVAGPAHANPKDITQAHQIFVGKVKKMTYFATPGDHPFRTPAFTAEVEIVKTLKGPSAKTIEVKTHHGEEPHAVCPIDLKERSSYLFFLGEKPEISRYSKLHEVTDLAQDQYVKDVLTHK